MDVDFYIDDDEFKSKLKTISEIDEGFNNLLRIANLNELEFEDFHKLFYQNLSFSVIPGKPIDVDLFKDLPIYRAREVNESGLDDLNDPNSFKGPPIGVNAGAGRAHWKGQNVFYGSADAITAILEKKYNDENDVELFLSKWEIDVDKFKRNKIFLANIISEDLPDTNPWKPISLGFDEAMKNMKNSQGMDFGNRFEYLIRKINELFLSANSNSYPISGFIANQIIYSSKVYDNILLFPILLYPSNVRKSVDSNFAIHPRFVDDYMRLINVTRIRVKGLVVENSKVIPIEFGAYNEGKVKWYSINEVYYLLDVQCSCCHLKINLESHFDFLVGDVVYSASQVVEIINQYDEQQKNNTVDFFGIEGTPSNREFENVIFLQNLMAKFEGKEHVGLFVTYKAILSFAEIGK